MTTPAPPPPAASRRANLLFAAALVMELAGGTAIVAVPLLAISFGASEFQLGSLGLCQRLPYVILCFVFGGLSDRIGRKALATTSCAGLILIYAAYLGVSTLWHLFALIPLAAVCVSLFWPPVQAWVSELPTATLGRRASFFNMAWSVGGTFGCLLGGCLAEQGQRLPFIVCLAFSLVLLVLITNTPAKRKPKGIRQHPEIQGEDRTAHPLTDTFLYASWVANFAAFASVGMLFFIFPKLAQSIGISKTLIGSLFFVSGLSRTLKFFSLGRSESWWYRLRGHVSAQVIGAIGIASVSFVEQWSLLAVAFLLVGYMCGTCYGASLLYCLRSVGKEGKRSGLHEGILVAGSMTGAFVGGILAEMIHPRSPYLFCAALILVAATLQTLLVLRGRRRLAAAEPPQFTPSQGSSP